MELIKKGEIIILIILFLVIGLGNLEISGLVVTSVTITDQVEVAMYEVQRSDFVFHISLDSDGEWYSTTDNITFTLENAGSTTIDVLLSSEDFDNGIQDGNYIDVNQNNGNFQIYIPDIDWSNIPDNNNGDEDGEKDINELCIANDLLVGRSLTGMSFRVRANNLKSGNYTARITITSYNSETSNPCSDVGEYVRG